MMSDTNQSNIYLIHDLMIIYVDKEVAPSVSRQIDFQIGYFRTKKLPKELPTLSIHVNPYNNLVLEEQELTIRFHLQRASAGKLFVDPDRRLTLIKGRNSYSVQTDKAFLINILMQLLWYERGYTFIHAAAVSDPDGSVILLPGAGGVGKTSLVGYLVRKHGFKVLGDDLVVIDEKANCYAFPRPFIIKEYHREDYPDVFEKLQVKQAFSGNAIVQSSKVNRRLKSAVRFAIDNAPFVGVTKSFLDAFGLLSRLSPYTRPESVLPFIAAVPIEDILGTDAVQQSGRIEKVFFLERSSSPDFHVEVMDCTSIANRIFSIIHHEWAEVSRQLFALGSTELEDTAEYFNQTMGIIEQSLSGMKCQLISIPDDLGPEELGKNFFALLENN